MAVERRLGSVISALADEVLAKRLHEATEKLRVLEQEYQANKELLARFGIDSAEMEKAVTALEKVAYDVSFSESDLPCIDSTFDPRKPTLRMGVDGVSYGLKLVWNSRINYSSPPRYSLVISAKDNMVKVNDVEFDPESIKKEQLFEAIREQIGLTLLEK